MLDVSYDHDSHQNHSPHQEIDFNTYIRLEIIEFGAYTHTKNGSNTSQKFGVLEHTIMTFQYNEFVQLTVSLPYTQELELRYVAYKVDVLTLAHKKDIQDISR